MCVYLFSVRWMWTIIKFRNSWMNIYPTNIIKCNSIRFHKILRTLIPEYTFMTWNECPITVDISKQTVLPNVSIWTRVACNMLCLNIFWSAESVLNHFTY